MKKTSLKIGGILLLIVSVAVLFVTVLNAIIILESKLEITIIPLTNKLGEIKFALYWVTYSGLASLLNVFSLNLSSEVSAYIFIGLIALGLIMAIVFLIWSFKLIRYGSPRYDATDKRGKLFKFLFVTFFLILALGVQSYFIIKTFGFSNDAMVYTIGYLVATGLTLLSWICMAVGRAKIKKA